MAKIQIQQKHQHAVTNQTKQSVDAQNSYAYHVLPREWAKRGLDLFEGDVEPKTLHQVC